MAADTELTKYICLFHHRDNAAAAIRDLESAGFSRNSLTVLYGSNSTTTDTSGGAGYSSGQNYASESTYGGTSELTSFGVPERDRAHLHDGLNSGGVVIGLEAAGNRANEIERIFHKHAAGKIDEASDNRANYAAPGAAAAAAAAIPARSAASEDLAIPVVEEELEVGKREVERGGVRVYRHVVEQPVSETVNLREEHAFVQRRPVDRPVTDADLRASDQTIELTETAEEAVVSKTARVVEEVHVGKEATEHTETIRDTVRRTEVDVEPVEGFSTTDPARRTN